MIIKKKHIIFLIILLACVLCNCSDKYQNNRYINILTSHKWVVNTFVDNSQNAILDTQNIIYVFNKNGDLEKIYECGFVATSTWELSPDNEYLTMGNNTFRLITLTKKLLSVRYGNIDMFFVSIN